MYGNDFLTGKSRLHIKIKKQKITETETMLNTNASSMILKYKSH